MILLTRLIGNINTVDDVICVTREDGTAIKDFISWTAFERWLIDNNFNLRFNKVVLNNNTANFL